MNNYRLTIQYDGGRYKGWQRLGNEDNTIQGKLEDVLSKLTNVKLRNADLVITNIKNEETELIGCSRTDAGVHAIAQIANFKTERNLSKTEIMMYFNQYLPKDICVTEVDKVPLDFHSRYLAKEKTYLYKIWNETFSNPFMRKYSMHVVDKLDIAKMKDAAQYFLGEHDFTAFSNAKSKKKSMVREIYAIDFLEDGGFLFIRVRGNGFLYNMVRKIVGTLVEVGLGNLKGEEIPEIMKSMDRSRVCSMADACGLYLEKITY